MNKKLLLAVVFFVIVIFAKAQTWGSVDAGLTTPDSSYDPPVYALCVYKGKLYAGGDFTYSGYKKVNYIACWDGAEWDTVGSGMNGTVKALCVYKGELYAGGDFNKAGGVRANKIAKWNGKKWLPLGSGIYSDNYVKNTEDNSVRALCVYHNELYACGNFTHAGEHLANCIAKWDSLHWSRVGQPLKSGFYASEGAGVSIWSYAMVVYNNNLYIGGYIDHAGDLKVNLACWNGVKWDSIPGTVSRCDSLNIITPIGSYRGKLLISTNSTYFIRGKKNKGVFAWNDTTWSDIGGEESGVPCIVCQDSNNLYVGGTFSKIGGVAVDNIAMWDDKNWQPIGDGLTKGSLRFGVHVTEAVSSLAIYKGYLYAGGYFNSSGRKPLKHIARWKLNK